MSPINSDLYGSAHLIESTETDISFCFLNPTSPSIPLGHNPDDERKGIAINLFSGGDPGHALSVGKTRSGKGVNVIIPALLTYRGSVVVIDPKGENAWITARYRSKFSRVVVLDPWNEVNERYASKVSESISVTKFNPLSLLDPESRDFNDDVVAIADALTVNGEGLDNHWVESARQLIAGLIAAAVESNPGKASLRDVRELITSSTEDLVVRLTQIHEANPESLAARKLRRFIPKQYFDKDGHPLPLKVSGEISSIRSTAETQTAVLDSENLLDAMETDAPPFNLEEMASGTVSLYLVLPVDKLETHGRWLRLILTQTLRTISRQRTQPEYPVLFILDEMGTIGNLAMVEQSFGLTAGLGVRIWGFLQDISQLKRDYPKSWETFFANSSVIQILNCGDLSTSEYVSRYLGNGTVNAKTGGYTNKQRQYAPGDSFDMRVINRLVQNWMATGMERDVNVALERARTVHIPPAGIFINEPDGSRRYKDTNLRIAKTSWALRDDIVQTLQSEGFSVQGYTEWSPDEQLAPRAVLLPDEVRDSPSDKSIILMPGIGNFRLKRFEYFSHPVLSARARHDPNKPAPVIKAAVTPQPVSPAPAPIVPLPAPQPVAANNNAAADIGAALGKKANEFSNRFLNRFRDPL